jgi:Carboxypeptidase regulatory-like domain/TonB dependent receptor/TonB-dependent Receptor Plug Domain
MPVAFRLLMKRSVVAAFLILSFVLQGTTSVLAGTTGGISGTVLDASTQRPIAGAAVTAQSPSQTAHAVTDAKGNFTFLSLNPDTYNLTVAAAGNYDAYTVNGLTVQADQNQTVTLSQATKLKTIGAVTSRAASALVKPGTTADVYSINAAQQDKASSFGGGGTLNSAYSAISTVPGVYVAPNQAGYIGAGPSLSIRGGDYDQIGYELDGIPVNRAFDNYPSGQLSSLGQQEIQVYTGAAPANSEGQGISGYINQVIKTGSAPAYRSLTLAAGGPAFYNKASFETGGANPSRTFSYYLGLGGYSQDYRYADQFNGASLSRNYGAPLAPCPGPGNGVTPTTVPSCFSPAGGDYTNGGTTAAYALGPYQTFSQSRTDDRDAVANFHFALPRKSGDRDDIQVLYVNNHLNSPYYISTNDQGGAAYLNLIGFGTPTYTDAYQSSLPLGSLLPGTFTGGGASQYAYPGSPTGRAFGSEIPYNQRDAFVNDQAILKLQYQRNFGSTAFLRVYGYTAYSDWLNNGPQTTYADYIGSVSPDYELNSHTRGLSATFTDQITDKHLLSIQGSYTSSNTLRDNNTQMINGFYGPNTINTRTAVGVLVDSTNPLNGICYNRSSVAVHCYNGSGSNLNGYAKPTATSAGNPNGAQYFTLQQSYNGTVLPASSFGTCGSGPCEYLVIGNGQYATYNTVKPKFSSASITDNWKPTDKLTINYGLRFDRFEYDGSNTTNSPARTFFYNAYNSQFPTNQQFNVPSQIESYSVLQPRVGATYAVDPRTVLRASYGRYAQAPNSAFQQYDFLQPNAPSGLQNFAAFGIGNTPGHSIRPPVSSNYDFSFEHQFNADTSIKLTPFMRKTQDQIQQFYLDQKTSFVSGLNVGNQTSSGIELEVDKGDFARNGLAGKFSFTYTNSYIRYNREPNGQSVVDGINTTIQAYNAYTKGGGGSPCYDPATGSGAACGAGMVANPYYNSPTQGLLDPNGKYATFDTFPGPIGVGYQAYGAPYIGTVLLQYKRGPLAITPALQVSGGQRYGVPANLPGIQPDTCTGVLAGSTTGDPRYNFGAAGGSPYDNATCATPDGTFVIPNPATGTFDGIGQYVAPTVLQLHLQTSYELSKRITLVSTLSNLVYSCFGGSKTAFTVAGACGYTATYGAGSGPQPIGNGYNPGNAIQPLLAQPYLPVFKGFPFNAYFEARIKI